MASIVVADAGPLHYLILLDHADILVTLFDHVLIPFAVQDELLHSGAPVVVRNWLTQPRPWFEVIRVEQPRPISGLHRGEAEALQLAIQVKAAGILMDDLDGRTAARRLGLTVIGTIGLLERAAEKEAIDLPDAIRRLRQTSFFASDELLDAALERHRQRKQGGQR